MALQTAQSMKPALWQILRGIPGGPVAYLNGLWGQLVGMPLCYKTEPVELNGKILLVSVSSLPWQRTLERMSDLLVQRINDHCDCSCVEQVCFQVAPVSHASRMPVQKGRTQADRPADSVPPCKDKGDGVENAEIVDAIRSVISRYF